ncbi:class I SAM-dependent methyltransferase [Georgenia sp. H159]|uniref:class I SAM-dependent methyltransferase n=1 Tax=Georgenia sp. H159 TaxID=3076115 RepID=UPI002D76CDD0|nr:methyltransferase domain-containing protein [Georgenia sp. H159]
MNPVPGARTFTGDGDAYDRFMGRYSRSLASPFADAAGVTRGQRALDVGCGPGALTEELVHRLGAEHVVGCDPSPTFLTACRERLPGVDLRAARAEALPFASGSVDVALAQLVLHFVSDPPTAVGEMVRTVTPGGRVAACVWDFAGGMEMLRGFWDAARTLDASAPDELRVMRFGRAGELAELLSSGGLRDVVEEPLTVHASYTDFDELWSTLLLGVGPAGSYVVARPEDDRERLRRAYLERLGRPHGSFTLRAVARAAVGTVPR